MASRRTGRVYRGERLVRRPHAFSNNEYSDSSTSEEHLETVNKFYTTNWLFVTNEIKDVNGIIQC